MAKLSELVRGFRTNIREGIPTILLYDGERISLNCSPNVNGYVGQATRKSQYDICTLWDDCKDCELYRATSTTPSCEENLIKPVITHLRLNK